VLFFMSATQNTRQPASKLNRFHRRAMVEKIKDTHRPDSHGMAMAAEG